MSGERILIADDDPATVEFLRDSLLIPRGYATLSATNGEEALRMALEHEPDLILLDVEMPRMDGIEVLEALRSKGRAIPTILITAHGSESMAVQAFRLGVREYFAKPFKVAEIMETVERLLLEAGLRRQKDELAARVESVNRQLRQRIRELNTLYGISKAVASVLDLDQVLTRIVEASRYVTGAEEASLFLRDQETQDVHLRALQGPGDPKARRLLRRTAQDDTVTEVLSTGQPTVAQAPPHTASERRLLTLAVPLKLRQTAIGALCVRKHDSAGRFPDSERYLLSALADHAAIAIENARLYEATQRELTQRKQAEETIRQLAYRDPLTGLPNRMLFGDRLRMALARARRYQHQVAVMILDLDHFKKVNDTLGHAVGDLLLRAVGERLVATLRESDTVCRLGGDEFVLLLPEMGKPECAGIAAERILRNIRKPFVLEQHHLLITTSIGVALYPDHGEDEDTLLRKADTAMYHAKEMGRDNCQRYRPQDDRSPLRASATVGNTDHPWTSDHAGVASGCPPAAVQGVTSGQMSETGGQVLDPQGTEAVASPTTGEDAPSATNHPNACHQPPTRKRLDRDQPYSPPHSLETFTPRGNDLR